MYMEKASKTENIEQLKRSLEDTMILTSAVKLALMNPDLDSESRGVYRKCHTELRGRIVHLKLMIKNARGAVTHFQEKKYGKDTDL